MRGVCNSSAKLNLFNVLNKDMLYGLWFVSLLLHIDGSTAALCACTTMVYGAPKFWSALALMVHEEQLKELLNHDEVEEDEHNNDNEEEEP